MNVSSIEGHIRTWVYLDKYRQTRKAIDHVIVDLNKGNHKRKRPVTIFDTQACVVGYPGHLGSSRSIQGWSTLADLRIEKAE